MKKNIFAFALAAVIAFSAAGPAFAADAQTVDNAIQDAAKYIYTLVKNPQVGSIGGEWAVLGLARSGYDVPQAYYDAYFQTVADYVTACGGNLHDKKYTEYSRVILGLTSAGFDAADVAGYDLTVALADFDNTIWQGINGPIFALISLDSGNYEMKNNPKAKTQATRDMYLAEILRRQLSDGGFNLTAGALGPVSPNEKADPDITGMAVQALAKYLDKPEVKEAVDRALECLSKMQDEDGGFSSWGSVNSESCVQVLVALCELGISVDDPRFVKNGNTLVDNLMTYYREGKGFLHTQDGSGSNQMSAEQGLYALAALQRVTSGKTSLYRMSDVTLKKGTYSSDRGTLGLPNKDTDVKSMPIVIPGKTFGDIQAHDNQPAIEALASRGIISGKGEDEFAPDDTMTRAEFAAIIIRGLGLPEKTVSKFADVPESSWFAPFVGSAFEYGIVTGLSDTEFSPNGTITRQEAAVMVARAAKLCGVEAEINDQGVRDILAQFTDYISVSEWARAPLAFCFNKNIISQDALDIRPFEPVKRCEIAEMLFRMLGTAQLA